MEQIKKLLKLVVININEDLLKKGFIIKYQISSYQGEGTGVELTIKNKNKLFSKKLMFLGYEELVEISNEVNWENEEMTYDLECRIRDSIYYELEKYI